MARTRRSRPRARSPRPEGDAAARTPDTDLRTLVPRRQSALREQAARAPKRNSSRSTSAAEAIALKATLGSAADLRARPEPAPTACGARRSRALQAGL